MSSNRAFSMESTAKAEARTTNATPASRDDSKSLNLDCPAEDAAGGPKSRRASAMATTSDANAMRHHIAADRVQMTNIRITACSTSTRASPILSGRSANAAQAACSSGMNAKVDRKRFAASEGRPSEKMSDVVSKNSALTARVTMAIGILSRRYMSTKSANDSARIET